MTKYIGVTSVASNLTTLAYLENMYPVILISVHFVPERLSLLILADHVNKEHGKALDEDRKKCLLRDAAFDTFDELSIHCKEHRSYSCDICYAGFISEPLLVEHRVNDYPQGRPAWSECISTPRVETITKDPEVEKALEVVRTPDPDPFADKGHPAIGHLRKDDKHKVECEVCHRYLKSFDLRVEHVKNFHPTVFYDCVFCPGVVFYTIQDLLNHCRELHFVCQQCDSAHNDQNTLKEHMATKHPPAPAQAAEASTRPGFICGRCNMYCCTAASFKIHLATHKKTPCPYCPQKFYNAASRNKHINLKHSDRRNRRLNCRMAPACKEMFNNIKELGIHSRQVHRAAYPFRCNYKDCFDCYRTIDGLVKHGKMHGKETWDATHSPEDRKDRYKCSLCPETFDLVA